MASTHTPTSKRRLTLGELVILKAAFAFNFAALCSGSAGLVLLASWWAFAITLAVILLYVPRGLDRILVASLIAAGLLTILLS
jgi:hypothetical protein